MQTVLNFAESIKVHLLLFVREYTATNSRLQAFFLYLSNLP